MHKSKRNIVWIIILSLLAGTISCNKFDDLKSPVDGFNIILNYDIFNTFITIRLIDAPTGELIGASNDEKVEVNISGDAADAVVDQLGNHSTSFNSVYGVVSLVLNPKNPWVPDKNNIISLNFEANNDTYKSSEIQINIDSIGNYHFDIYMEQKNVEQTGIKEYSFYLPLNENNKLRDEFSFFTSGNEMQVTIPKDSEFMDDEGKIYTGEQIKINLKVFLSVNKATVPHSFINNLITLNDEVSTRAIDFYRIAEIHFYDESGNELTGTSENISIRLQVAQKNYNPAKNRDLSASDTLVSYVFDAERKLWKEYKNMVLLSDTSAYFGTTSYSRFPIIAFGNSVNTCELNAAFQFNFTNTFDELPVGTRINVYRKRDNQYISSKTIQVEKSGQESSLSFLSVENEPVRFYVYNQSSANPFKAEPASFYSEQSCNSLLGSFKTELTSNRAQLNGKLSISYLNDLPVEFMDVYVDILRVSNHSRLYRQQIRLTPTDTVFEISTGILADNEVYLKFIPLSNRFQIKTIPEQVFFNTSNSPFDWHVQLSTEDISREFTFDFDVDNSFENRELKVRAEFYNRKTDKVDLSFTFPVSKNNSTFTRKVVLNKETPYRMKIKRTEGKELFMAMPYSANINEKANTPVSYQIELLPVVKKEVTASIILRCGSSIIYPSVNGMFRTVWDDKWKEIKIEDGNFTQIFEIGATYEIGTVFEGALVTTTYLIDETEINMEMELEGDFCDQMGW